MPISQSRNLLRGRIITFEEALEEEQNILHQLDYPSRREEFLGEVIQQTSDIEATVAGHLGIDDVSVCRLSRTEEWMHGSFNLCIPVHINKWGGRVIIRFPLPYKTGELVLRGNSDEKLRCEVATYVWIQENCPEVPTPTLRGFGFTNGQRFKPLGATSFFIRLIEHFRRGLRYVVGSPIPCAFVCERTPHPLSSGYLIIDYIEEEDATMLSDSWEQLRGDRGRRTTLFKDLSRIMLSLGRTPLPRIGSMTIGNDGVLKLANRPLTLRLQQLENECIPTPLSRSDTYTTIEPYLQDLLSCHDSRLLHQPNAVNDEEDCREQMAALCCMRAVLHHFVSRDLRSGPFLYTLTDMHQSNIFVDADWHVKYIIDLEWACSLPVEMQQPPYWLTNQGIDELVGDDLAAYEKILEEFLHAFEIEERCFPPIGRNELARSRIMRNAWDTGSSWYFHAVNSTTGLISIFYQHIQPRFTTSQLGDEAFERIISSYWCPEANGFVIDKRRDLRNYREQLQSAFTEAAKLEG